MSYFEWTVIFFLFLILVQLVAVAKMPDKVLESQRKLTESIECLMFIHLGDDEEKRTSLREELRDMHDEDNEGSDYRSQIEYNNAIGMLIFGAVFVVLIPLGITVYPYVKPYILAGL